MSSAIYQRLSSVTLSVLKLQVHDYFSTCYATLLYQYRVIIDRMIDLECYTVLLVRLLVLT